MPKEPRKPSLGGQLGGKKRESRIGSRQLSTKAQVNKHEESLAEALGGRRVPASGAGNADGDISLKDFLFESKETSGNTLVLHAKDVVKITREAWGAGKSPGLIITIHGMDPAVPKEFVAVPIAMFKELLDNQK
mgnify:CR=1 FL=1